MKWIFLLAIILGVPALVALLRENPRNLVRASFILGASMLILGPNLWTAPIPWPTWPGPVKGMEVSFIDTFSVAMILSTKPVSIPWWLKGAFLIYCVALLISTPMASQWMPSAFYAWQLARSALLFVAISRTSVAAKKAPIALMAGLGFGLGYEGLLALYQYHNGVQRAGGNFGHANFLGLVSDFVTFPALALALGTRRTLWPAGVLLAGFAIAVVGGSRATLGLFAIGIGLTVLFSLYRGFASRKAAFGSLCVLTLLISAPVMISAVNNRSRQVLVSSDADREAMKDAAGMMIGDHPLGVGANQYVVVANTGGYSQRAGVPWNVDNRSAPVHDAYYLIAAELGVIGLIGFISIITSLIFVGLINLRWKSDDRAELVPGLLATLVVASIHISYEWVFMQFILHYMFALASGLLVGITCQARRNVKSYTVRNPNSVPATVRG